jgi:peroxiredoxin
MICQIELGELEKHHAEFAKREARIVVASVDGLGDTQKTQIDFKHLIVLSDEQQSLVKALDAVHSRAGPKEEDIAAPTTLLIDRNGRIVWTFRPKRHIERTAVKDLLAAVDKHLR